MLDESEYLALSGIQHYFFCQRQWALIHMEQFWFENILTAFGKLMHDRADDEKYTKGAEGAIVERSLPLSSQSLGIYGIADIVEFWPSSDGVKIRRRTGRFQILPVEYKRGKSKIDDCDRAQLCLQAMCLEEMFGTSIEVGCLFYGLTRRREEVLISSELRTKVIEAIADMRNILESKRLPLPLGSKKPCKSCSLIDRCLPNVDNQLGERFQKAARLQLEGGSNEEDA